MSAASVASDSSLMGSGPRSPRRCEPDANRIVPMSVVQSVSAIHMVTGACSVERPVTLVLVPWRVPTAGAPSPTPGRGTSRTAGTPDAAAAATVANRSSSVNARKCSSRLPQVEHLQERVGRRWIVRADGPGRSRRACCERFERVRATPRGRHRCRGRVRTVWPSPAELARPARRWESRPSGQRIGG